MYIMNWNKLGGDTGEREEEVETTRKNSDVFMCEKDRQQERAI